MPRKMYWFYWFLLILNIKLSKEFIDETKTEVKVGALFFKDENAIELSFDEAFRELNSIKLFELKFVTIKRYVPNDDSFVLQQLTCELISNGVAAIFGPSSKASSDIVALIANTTGIPHIQYDWNIETTVEQRRLNHRMSVNVAPPLSAISRALFDIIKTNYGWKTFTIYYETEQGLTRLQDLMNIQSINQEFIKLRNIADFKNDIRVLWKETEEIFHEYRLIIDCEPESLVHLLNTAKDFKLLGPFKNWFITHLDSHSSGLKEIYNADFKSNITSVRLKLVDLNPYERRKTRITEIDQILGNQTMMPVLVYDAVVLYANAARNIISVLKEYNEPYRRCDFGRAGPWYLGRLIVEEMKEISEDDVEPPFKTENMKIDEYGQRSQFNLEIYKPTVNEPMALWKSSDNSITPIKTRQEFQSSSSSSAQDFSQERKTYIVVSHIEPPYFMLKEDYENFRGPERYEGYAVDLIRKLAELMEFDYEFMIVDSNGKYNPKTKQWDGIMRKLIDHHAQIGICDLTITQLRRKYVDFTVPFMQLGISILFYKADPEPKDPFAFLQPFAKEVWYFMILTQLVITLLFVFMARISSHEWENPEPSIPDPDELENIWRTRNTAWLMIGSIMQQGCDILPKGAPMRILSAMWWFFALMMLSTYTANLAAFLTSNRNKPSINSLEDLTEQDKIKYGTFNGGSTSLFFSESNDTIYKKAWNQMKSFDSAFTSSNKEGVDRVNSSAGTYAFLMETTGLLYNTERNCHLQQIGGQIGEKHYGLAVPLGADYRTNLSVSILKLSEKGELYKLKNKWWMNRTKNCEELDGVLDGDELSLIELGGVFYVLAGGVLVAIIIGVLEFLWNVQRVAVEEMVTPGEAFKAELLFVLKFWITKKPNRISSITTSSSSSSRSSHTNSRRSSLQSKQSKHSKHSSKSRRSKRSKRSRSRSKSKSKNRSNSS